MRAWRCRCHRVAASEGGLTKPKGAREKALLQELKLTAPNARPKGNYDLVGQLVEAALQRGDAMVDAVADAMADPRISIKSPATIKRLHRQYLAARAEHDTVH